MSKLVKFGMSFVFFLSVISLATSLMLAAKDLKGRDILKRNEMNILNQKNLKSDFNKKIKQYDEAKKENENLKKRLAELKKEFDSVSAEYTNVKENVSVKETEIGNLAKEKEKLSNSLEDLRKNSQAVVNKEEIADLKSTLDEVQKELDRANSENKRMIGKLANLNEQLETKQNELVMMAKRESEYMNQVKGLKSQVDQLRDISGQSQESYGKSEAAIEVVNREMKFIVFAMGEEDGVKVGDRMRVYRNENWLGDIYVDEVFQNMASASINPELIEKNISEGDSVRK